MTTFINGWRVRYGGHNEDLRFRIGTVVGQTDQRVRVIFDGDADYVTVAPNNLQKVELATAPETPGIFVVLGTKQLDADEINFEDLGSQFESYDDAIQQAKEWTYETDHPHVVARVVARCEPPPVTDITVVLL